MFLLLVYFSGLDARNLLYQPCFHAYIGFCSWTLTWLSVTVIYVWPFVLKPQLKKKKLTLIILSQPWRKNI